MKKTFIVFFAFAFGVAAFAQGQINFNTHITSDIPPVDARIYLPDVLGTPGASGPTPAAGGFGQLVIVNGNSLTPLTPIVPFGTGASDAGYLNGGIATAPSGFPGGTSVVIVLRAWLGGPGSTFDASVWKMDSFPLLVTLEEAPHRINDLIGLQIGVLVPEPTTLMLGLFGLGAMLLWMPR